MSVRRNMKSLVFLAVVSALILWGFAVLCSAAAPSAGASDAVWLRYMKTDYGLDEKDVQPLRASGMGWADIASYLESLYPHAPLTIGTDDFVRLAHASGTTPLEAIEAYKLAVRNHIDPAWLSRLYRETGSWERIKTALTHRDQAHNLVFEGNAKAPFRHMRSATGQTLEDVYGLPPDALLRASGIAGDEETLINAMFVLEIASADDAAAETASLEQLIPALKRSPTDLQPLAEPWTLRKFPAELLPLVPPASTQARALARPAIFAAPYASECRNVSATGSGSTMSIIDPSVLYGTSRVSPFKAYFDGFAETVDPSSGALMIRQTDFTLPGRGGLDFNLTRVYNSGLAGFDLPRVHAKYVETEDDYYISKVWGETIPSVYFEKRFGLGVGWRLAYPTIEFIDGQKYLHMDDGGVYKIGGGYYDDVGYYLVDYDVQDMTFSADKSYASPLDGVRSAYKLRRKDGVEWLFGADGRLLCIRDRFDNAIRFRCEVPSGGLARIAEAVDTVGRRILFSYQANQVVVTVNPVDGSPTRMWIYTLDVADANHSDRKRLSGVTPPAGRPISYSYSVNATTFTPHVDGMTGDPVGFDYLSLANIYHQGNVGNSAITRFLYQQAHKDLNSDDPSRDDPSDLGYFRVAKRWDDVPTTVVDGAGSLIHPIMQNGEAEYAYQPWDSSQGSYGCTRTPKRHASEAGVPPAPELWRFDKKHRPVSHSVEGVQSGSDRNQSESATTVFSYVGDDGKLPMQETKTIKVGTSSRREVARYVWDGRGDLVATIDPAGRKTENWHDGKYALLTMRAEETAAPDGSKAARVLENRLNPDKKTVKEQWTYMAQPSAGGTTTYTADIVRSDIPEGSFWVWSPPGTVTSVTLRIGWSVKFLFDVAEYKIYYRELGTSAWTYYGGKSYWGLAQVSSDTWNISLSSTPKRYDVKVEVVYSPIWMESASAMGPGPAWAPKNAAEISRQALQYDQTYKCLPTRSSILGFGAAGEESVTIYRYDDRHLFPTSMDCGEVGWQGVRVEASYDGYGRVAQYNKYAVGSPSAAASYSCFTYDAIDRLLTVERPAQSQTGGYTRPTCRRVYDDQNFIVTASDELNHRTRETYDGLGRFVLAEQEETPGVWRQVAHVQYDSLGRAAREYDAFGTAHETKYEYDAFGRRIKTYYPKEANESEYDRVFSESWSVSAGPVPTSLGLPAPPRDAGFAGYDSAVRWEKESAARKASEAERPTSRGFDIAGRLIWSASRTGPGPCDWSVSCYRYDALDRLEASWVYRRTDTDVWDETSYEYGLHFDAPTAMSLPGNGNPEPRHVYEYNSRGLTTAADPGTLYAVHYTYDGLDRLIRTDYSDQWRPMETRYSYDQDGNVVRAGLYMNGTCANSVDAEYNLRGWLESETWTIDYSTYSIRYRYDDVGNRTKMTYPNGISFSFEHDARNRLVRIPGYFGAASRPEEMGFGYDGNGSLTYARSANGVITTRAYDSQGRTKSLSVTRTRPAGSVMNLAYSYTSQGNASTIAGMNGALPFTLNYGYDWIGRLTSADVLESQGTARVLYGYDGADNRTWESWSDGRGTVQYKYKPGNYLKSRGQAVYSWGMYGQLTSKTDGGVDTEYRYNPCRLMISVQKGKTTLEQYRYDALGRRIKTVKDGSGTIALYCGNDIVYEVRGVEPYDLGPPGVIPPPNDIIGPIADLALGAANGRTAVGPEANRFPPPGPGPATPSTCYLVLDGKYLAKIVKENPTSEQTYFCHTDMVGSIRAITDSAGQVVARFEYEPFGLLTMSTGPIAAGAHRFTGKPEDGATELYYFGARYYDPEVGRFISRDPARDGLNLYEYCRSNPLRYIDPNGTWTVAAGGNVVAAFLLKVGLTGQIVRDGHGNVGILVAVDAGGGTPNIGAAGAFTYTAADTIFDLSGIGWSAGGSAGLAWSIGLEATGSDECVGVTGTIGISALPAEGHGTINGCLVFGVSGRVQRFIEDRIVPWMFEQARRLPDPIKRVIMDRLSLPPEAFGVSSGSNQNQGRPTGSAPHRVTFCAV